MSSAQFLVDVRVEMANPPPATAQDAFVSRLNGGYDTVTQHPPELDGSQVSLPEEALGTAEHFNDDPNGHLWRAITRRNPADLPREQIFCMICGADLRRPTPRTY